MIRKCMVCGKRLNITVSKVGTITGGGEYFGTFKLPVGEGVHQKIGYNKQLKVWVAKWTGKEKDVEYWECSKCFKED